MLNNILFTKTMNRIQTSVLLMTHPTTIAQ